MIPIAPLPPGPTPAAPSATLPVGPAPLRAEAPAAARPMIGAEAVTAAAASRGTSLRAGLKSDAREEDPAPEPQRDPRPVRGLGVPPLHTARVGDLDRPPLPLSLRPDAEAAFAALPAPDVLAQHTTPTGAPAPATETMRTPDTLTDNGAGPDLDPGGHHTPAMQPGTAPNRQGPTAPHIDLRR